MKTTKTQVNAQISYLSELTGKKLHLSSQCAGRGKGYALTTNNGQNLNGYHMPWKEFCKWLDGFKKGLEVSGWKSFTFG